MTRMRQWARRAGASGVFAGAAGMAFIGCLDRPLERVEPRTTSTVVERLTQSGVDKIDLLLAIDNSISMGDKQEILALAVPDLVDRLVNPICVDKDGVASPTQPSDPTADCPTGFDREFDPITDINVGVISSSLGALTGEFCDGAIQTGGFQNDRGRLLSRATGGGTVPTFENKGFLAWDPENKRGGTVDADALVNTLRDLVVGVGQDGCGFEMPLEAIYRFLVDPAPYDTLVRQGSNIAKQNVDEVLLQQRRDFLRSNSLLAIVLLADENDCSVAVESQGFLLLNNASFYRSTNACAADPNDKCCTTCFQGGVVEGCPSDNGCTTEKYTTAEDPPNLRCFNQKQRYGVNFLYPTQRYVNALRNPTINPARVDLSLGDSAGVPNPIFSDISGAGGTVRDPGLVFFAGIVGVPWQAIARKNDQGQPDLNLGYKTFDELQVEDAFTKLVGNPDGSIYPTDPFMQESIATRSGTSELTGASLPGTNTINGNDRTIATGSDLQYACIFPLTTPQPNTQDCAQCIDASCNNPLCNGTTQVNAKAYPGLRELAVVRGMGGQGITASVCPAQQNNPAADDFGYRPAVAAIIDRLKTALGGQCLPRKLTPDAEGNVPCLVLEASVNDACDCNAVPGRRPVPEDKAGAIEAAKQDEFKNDLWNCFCEIVQLTGEDRTTCQTQEEVASTINGWCYIDATTVPPTGDPALVASCPPNEQRLVRFPNPSSEPQTGATVFITCSGE